MSKECQRFQEILNRFHDGETSPQESSLLKDHLEACPHCKVDAASMEKISLFFKRGIRLRASNGFTERVMQGIEKEASLFSWDAALPMIKRLAVAAAIVMMISFSFLAFDRGGNKGESTDIEWKGFLSSHTFSQEDRAVLFGEGLPQEYKRKIWTIFER